MLPDKGDAGQVCNLPSPECNKIHLAEFLFLYTRQGIQYSLVVGNRCAFPLMVIFLSVHSCTSGMTGSAGGFAGLSVMVFMDVSTLALNTGCWISGKLTYPISNACCLPRIM